MDENAIDWAAVRPGDPDPTPDSNDNDGCNVFIADAEATAGLALGLSPGMIVMLHVGTVFFCTRRAHPGDGVHLAGGGERVLARWVTLDDDPDGSDAALEFSPDLTYLSERFR